MSLALLLPLLAVAAAAAPGGFDVYADRGRLHRLEGWSKPKALSGKKSSASYPRVVVVGEGFRAFWREKDRFNDAPLD